MDITHLLALSIKEGASDLHLSAGLPPILRIDVDLVRMDLPVLRPKQVDELINEVLNETQIKALKDGIEIDFSFEIPDVARFRANIFNQNRGEAAVFRAIPSSIPTLNELGLGEIFKSSLYYPVAWYSSLALPGPASLQLKQRWLITSTKIEATIS